MFSMSMPVMSVMQVFMWRGGARPRLSGSILLFVHKNINLRRADPAAVHTENLQARSNTQRSDGPFKDLRRHSVINQRRSAKITIFFNSLEGRLYRHLERRLAQHMRELLRRSYGLDRQRIVVEQPPKVEFGEYALPLAFELAKKLRKPPRKIAEEIVSGIGSIAGIEKFEVAGAGYINVRIRRRAFAQTLASGEPSAEKGKGSGEKVLVEHTSINPNKAAHVGHLRNAILGDTFVRLLRSAGTHVD